MFRLPRLLACARTLCCLVAGVSLLAGPAASAAEGAAPRVAVQTLPPPRLSAALEMMLRDELSAGRAIPPDVVRLWDLDRPVCDDPLAAATAARAPGSGVGRAAAVELAPDVQVNNKAGDVSCSACLGRPLGQVEATIASLGDDLLAGWNDAKGFCTGRAVQGYGYSTNRGATWTDGDEMPPLPSGGRWRGDPVHAVNRTTGDFYMLGLYEGGVPGSGLALARGHFSGGAFVFDLDTQIAWDGGVNFLDKPWIACDPATGYLYVTYSNFVGGSTSQIELIRSTTNGVSWDPPIVLSSPASYGFVQSSRPAIGPGGEVYVTWDWEAFPQNHIPIRRSNSFGTSFGPEVIVADIYENEFSGAPGFRRGFGFTLPGIAVDNSSGPHRGRVYVTWDETVNFWDTNFSIASPISEVEDNGFFKNATAFNIGDVLRGAFSSTTDVDLFKFSGARGQTVFFRGDSINSQGAAGFWLLCGADTSSLGNYRFLAFNTGYPLGFPGFPVTLPVDGTYYLRLVSAAGAPVGGYRILTAFDTPSPGERARFNREQFVSHSDDGASWSTPARLDDRPLGDGIFPEVTVDGTGTAHCYWHDFRDDATCGAMSDEYLTSSADGGVTWGPNRRMSDASSFWSFLACGSANQGDYQGITSEGATVYPCWTDSRLGDPDVFMEASTFQHTASCPAPAVANGGSSVAISFQLANTGNVGGTYHWALTDDNGWLISATPAASGTVALAASTGQTVQGTFSLPYGCTPAAVDTVHFVATALEIPGRVASCGTTLGCNSVLGVGGPVAALWFAPPRPNPSPGVVTLGFSLPRAGAVRLALYGARGEQVRALASGERPAGSHIITWDGRDDRGRHVAPGLYYARLDAAGRVLERTVAVVK